jgi:hypothetical protein
MPPDHERGVLSGASGSMPETGMKLLEKNNKKIYTATSL